MKHTVTLEVDVVIVTTDEGEAGIERYVGLTPEQGAELSTTPGMTKDDVLQILARSCIFGRSDANQDGWADLDRDSIRLHVDAVRDI